MDEKTKEGHAGGGSCMTATPMDEPGRTELMAWLSVYGAWLKGDPKPMAEWLRHPETVIVDDARHFLADNLLKPIKRQRGVKLQTSNARKRHIAAMVYAAREAMPKKYTAPSLKAIQAIATREKMDEESVRRIMGEMSKAGITFEVWKRIGRPKWDGA